MKTYFQNLLKILVGIFKCFFLEETKKEKSTAYELLIRASICDTIDFVVKQSRNHEINCKEPTEELVVQQKELILERAPLIPDIKKQFSMWSANMREYDSIRKQLLDTA